MISQLRVRLQTIHVLTIKMKFRLLFVFLLLAPVMVQAADDPILFTVGDMPVTRSEFEQSYLKNTTVSAVSRQTIANYLESYIVHKLKVKAALDAHIDATSSFMEEYGQCSLEQPTIPMVSSVKSTIPSSVVYGEYEKQLRKVGFDGLICPAQIFIRVSQQAFGDEQRKARQRIESIYQELLQGADFAQLARQYSHDETSSSQGGTMGWYARGQMFKEIEDVAFALKKGEISRPFLSTLGYHILLMTDRKPLEDYTFLGETLSAELEQRQIHQQVRSDSFTDEVIEEQNVTPMPSLLPVDALQKEYYEGLLVHELSRQSTGTQAAENEEALKYYFKKNKKKYKRKGFNPKSYIEIRELVVADLQQEMDKHWVTDLRNKYPVNVNKDVLKTVNNHL